MIFLTGGAGFIGSNLVRHLIGAGEAVVNLDKLTYAGNLQNLASIDSDKHIFVNADIADQELVSRLLAQHMPRAVVNLAAESHVDRSIRDPECCIQTNVVGTLRLLKASLGYWANLSDGPKSEFRFLHVSTDEVYGSLSADDAPFSESTTYAPNSPYAASKAASDHLVRSFFHTYGLPVVTTNCSNNYGPYQFPEKLIPLTIHNALAGKAIPLYGDGENIRDWLYVSDHCDAIERVLSNGRLGETYNIGASCEKPNIEIVRLICAILDEERPGGGGKSYAQQISFVKDRPGHDLRYAIDANKIRAELGWGPKESFETGLRKTVNWYLTNQEWVRNVATGAYHDWMSVQYSGNAEDPQRDHSGGRIGNATLSSYQSRVETASADL
jgi:dTDP-glucose 4,6-dehydratase